ncbi:hypothetical protein [Bacillus taeanensis]|uniref:Uncharacterized protein n=1 Tax=Bacillus taeanensis TaxID=273032 RepID=A0A366XTU8_9BACI|nr:hypothetical protein [Bacillus taeanensis]RBW69790.1 hypothetical protein DS031_09670 [Bacillus taeanensis]
MIISGHIEALPSHTESADTERLHHLLKIYMQRLGFLTSFRENLNHDKKIDDISLGDESALRRLKKAAARSDRVLLFYAKWTKATMFQHVICHPNDEGVYLPFPFDEPFYIELDNKKVWIGSSPRLLEELKWLQQTIENNQPSEVIEYWKNLRIVAEKSIHHTSPLLFKKVTETNT